MSIQAQIASLETLASIDAELATLDEELTSERTALEGKKEQLDSLEEKLTSHNSSIDEMDRTRNELIQEVRQMSVQVERSREKLSRCRTEREANAAQREVEELRKLYRDRELEIEKLVGLADQARSDLEATVAERDEIAGELGSSATDVATKLKEIEERVASKRAEREAAVGKVKPALFRKYELIRKRRGTALCYTTDGSCSACHMQLPPMVFQHLMRGEDFDQCPSCNRLIYYRTQQEAAESQSSGA